MIAALFPPRIEGEIHGKTFRGEIEYRLKPEMGDVFRVIVRTDSCLVEGGKNGLLYARDLRIRPTNAQAGDVLKIELKA